MKTTYPETAPFAFTRNGHASRRDDDALPTVLLVDMSPCGQTARLHFAGEFNIRVARVSDLARDTDTLERMAPLDAFHVGRAAHA